MTGSVAATNTPDGTVESAPVLTQGRAEQHLGWRIRRTLEDTGEQVGRQLADQESNVGHFPRLAELAVPPNHTSHDHARSAGLRHPPRQELSRPPLEDAVGYPARRAVGRNGLHGPNPGPSPLERGAARRYREGPPATRPRTIDRRASRRRHQRGHGRPAALVDVMMARKHGFAAVDPEPLGLPRPPSSPSPLCGVGVAGVRRRHTSPLRRRRSVRLGAVQVALAFGGGGVSPGRW